MNREEDYMPLAWVLFFKISLSFCISLIWFVCLVGIWKA